MRILVLGGTRFAGRAIVETALGRGDTVTMFNRGKSNPGLFPGVETVTGDRTADLSPLDGREFDAVIDVACYAPETARLSADAFKDRTGRYVFVSTVSVYASQATTEAQRRGRAAGPAQAGQHGLRGELRREQGAVRGGRQGGLRQPGADRPAGLISGPHDPTDRFPYWPRRIARGGRVLVPGDPTDLTQVIDARDIAAFLLDGIHRDRSGVFNLTGNPRPFGYPARPVPGGDLQRRRPGVDRQRAAGGGRGQPGRGHSAVDR